VDRRSPERLNQSVADALMVPLAMVVGHEVGNGAPKMALTERDHAIEALLLDRSHEALRVGVTVWRAKRRLHDPHSFPLEELPHGIC
jgi:hypothetical protein